MADLACDADILTPNLTEASIILGTEWHGTDISDDEAKDMIDKLIAKGAKSVVLKGIQREGDNEIRNFVGGVDCDVFEVHNEFVPYLLHGTGDLYASCLLAGIMAGRTLYEAAWFAGNLTHDAIEVSTKQPHFQERGVNFEPLLGKVAALLG
jgi:pyridoxine kinase